MQKKTYKIQGSASEPYSITISKIDNKMRCVCNCPAGTKKKHCKHWMSLFDGTKQDYIDLTDSEIEEIQSWIKGSDLEDAWNSFNEFKKKEIEFKEKLSELKKQIMKKMQTAMLDI